MESLFDSDIIAELESLLKGKNHEDSQDAMAQVMAGIRLTKARKQTVDELKGRKPNIDDFVNNIGLFEDFVKRTGRIRSEALTAYVVKSALEKSKENEIPHVEIPQKEQYAFDKEKSAGEKLGEAIESEIIAFGGKHGFPVIYVITEQDVFPKIVIGGNVVRGGKLNLFIISEMREAERIAKKYNGTIGICKDPAEKYRNEFEQAPAMDKELPNFCKAHHCTKRNKACATCAYTAFSSEERRRLEDRK